MTPKIIINEQPDDIGMVGPGLTAQLSATTIPIDAKVKWSLSYKTGVISGGNPGMGDEIVINNHATIDNNGYLTVSEWEYGTLTIIATLIDYPTFSDSIVLYDA